MHILGLGDPDTLVLRNGMWHDDFHRGLGRLRVLVRHAFLFFLDIGHLSSVHNVDLLFIIWTIRS